MRVGLATCETMIPVYQALVDYLSRVPKDAAGPVDIFNLDEYWPVLDTVPAVFARAWPGGSLADPWHPLSSRGYPKSEPGMRSAPNVA